MKPDTLGRRRGNTACAAAVVGLLYLTAPMGAYIDAAEGGAGLGNPRQAADGRTGKKSQ